MKGLARPPLPAAAEQYVAGRAARLAAKQNQKPAADAFWKAARKTRGVLSAEAELALMSGGRCMYCEQREATHIDHFWPRALKPELTFCWDNWILSCGVCNSEYKGEKYHDDMLDPTDPAYRYAVHFEYEKATGELALLTAASVESARICGLNRHQLNRSRKSHFRDYQYAIIYFSAMKESGRDLAW
jgi:uncharacterized protein (TIGR02646 family)